MKFRLWLLVLTALVVCSGRSDAQRIGDKSHLQPSLVADTTAIQAGKPFTVGLRLVMDPGWHTYWRYPGDSGGAPRVEWQLPAGFKAGEIQWPMPQPHVDDGDFLTYVYDDEVLLMVEITPPAQLPPGEVKIDGHLQWLVCEKTCVPGDGNVSVTLTTSGDAAAGNADLFSTWRAQLPKSGPPPFETKWEITKTAATIKVSDAPRDAQLQFFPLPPTGASTEHPTVSEIAADGSRIVTVAFTSENPLTQPWRGVLALQKADGSREGWMLEGPAPAAVADSAPATSTAAPETSAPVAPSQPPVQRGLFAMLGIAFVGGLILNVMPCVLPVIALKIFGFMNQAGESRQRIFRLGLAFVAGVFTFFLGLAVAVLLLKSSGLGLSWGYQFQNPYVLSALIALVFVFGLNMLGVFEITLGGGAASKLSELSGREGYGGAFLHGLFTTLLGTSCTAPFLAQSLGYAVTQPAPMVVALFLAIAMGMSLPYFLLTAQPAWLRYLPKPGIWMERVKQLLAFVVLGVAVWLLTVLIRNHGASAGAAMSWYLLALGAACWAVGAFAHRTLAWVGLIVVAAGGYFFLLLDPLSHSGDEPLTPAAVAAEGGINWQPWSEAAVAAASQSGQPVFVDFTADWCLNCKVLEKTVLETDAIRTALKEKNVATFRADLSRRNPQITAALNRFGRVGVPLYVLYRPGEAQPVVMDGLTKGGLLNQLSQVRSPNVATH